MSNQEWKPTKDNYMHMKEHVRKLGRKLQTENRMTRPVTDPTHRPVKEDHMTFIVINKINYSTRTDVHSYNSRGVVE